MSAVKTPNQGWQNLLGSRGLSPGFTQRTVRLEGDRGQCLLQAGLPGGTAPMAVYLQATVRAGRVSITASSAGVVTPIVDLEPAAGGVNGGPRALSIELPLRASLLTLNAGAPGTVIDLEALAVGPAGALGPVNAPDGASGTPRAASTTQAEPAVQPRNTTTTGTNGGTPGDGGTLGESAVGITIDSATINGAEPGVSGQLQGTYSSGDLVDHLSLSVTCQGATTETVQYSNGTWTAMLRFYSAGSKAASAHIQGEATTGSVQHIAVTTVTVTLTSSAPAFNVTAPAEGATISLPEGGQQIPVDAQTNPVFGGRTITAVLDSTVQQNTSSGSAALLVSCNGTPVGARVITVTCSDPGGNVSTIRRSIQLVDKTPPALAIASPADNQAFVGDETGVTVTVGGTAPDHQTGVASVTWTLSPAGAWAAVDSLDAQGNWHAAVTLPTFGAFTIYVRATDHAGNQSTQPVNVLVLSSYVPASLDERLDDAHYLFALLQFADAEGRVAGAGLDEGTLGSVLLQPFDRLSQITPGAAAVAAQPVNELRVPLEILRRQADAPFVTAYSFEANTVTGSSVSDVAGHGDTGTLVGAATIGAPGRFAGQALVVADASSGLRVPSSPRLNIGGGDGDFTAALWVNPDQAPAAAALRVMLHKGDESGGATDRIIALFLAADGALQARTSLAGHADVGIDRSTRALEAGRWTHVALVRRGGELLLYLDGVLDASADLPGGAAAPSDAPLFVGYDGKTDAVPGRYDDVRVYRLALSQSAVQTLASAPTPAPVSGDAVIAEYCRTSYEALLTAFGTSSAELRLSRGADSATTAALAARLGVPVDALATLTLDEPGQTETALESLFGLRSTDPSLDVLRPAPPPQLLSWREATMRLRWASEDRAGTGQSFAVILDPDIISPSDFVNPAPPDPAPAGDPHVLLSDRAGVIAAFRASLDAARTPGPSPGDDYKAVLAKAGLSIDELQEIATARTGGTDVTAQLAALGLTLSAFELLWQVKQLADAGPVLTAEWNDVEDILVAAHKQTLLADWRAAESALTLSPDVFRLDGTAPVASPWRASADARAGWLAVLRRRTDEQAALEAGYAAAVASVEQTVLPTLRDGLVADLADEVSVDDAADWLTDRYQVDMRKGGSLSTTRVEQAADTLQSTLYAVRTASLPAWHPAVAWTIAPVQVAEFDAAWKWMSEVGSWQASMQTFLLPERDVDPANVPNPSAGYAALVDKLASPGLTPSDLSGYLSTYSTTVNYGAGAAALHAASKAALNGQRDPGGNTWQTYCGVPLLVARAYTTAANYDEALDWYRRVYDYEAPPGQRAVYAGLDLEAIGAPDLTFKLSDYTNFNPHTLAAQRPNPYTRYFLLQLVRCFIAYGDAQFTRGTTQSRSRARALYEKALELLADPALRPITPTTVGEGAYPLPDVAVLSATAATQLAKLRQGLTIAGLPAPAAVLADTATPVHPSQYRYKTLLARAQQLVGQAQQIEAQYLAALEKQDAKALQVFDAQQALDLAGAQVTLQGDRVDEAKDNQAVANAQLNKAQTMQTAYQTAAAQGPNQYEQSVLAGYQKVSAIQNTVAQVNATIGAVGAIESAVGNAVLSWGASVVVAAAQTALYVGQADATASLNKAQAQLSANQLLAGVAQRQAEYTLQATAAGQDVLVAQAQVTAASDQLFTAQQEEAIASKQQDLDQKRLDFLNNQFTNDALYGWMSDVLGGVYRYFLQQATSVALAAQDQLAFERGETPQTDIATDYWTPPTALATGGQGGSTVQDGGRGLTGAERLDEDLTRLDQYAFVTDRRRLNLSQTFSLADRAALELVELRSTGTVSFATPMAWFDEAYPGHYLRLIRTVRVSIVALVPPSIGVRATLRSSGLARVAAPTGDGIVSTLVYGTPEVIAFTSPVGATGVFDVDLQPDMLLPFEATGVDTSWTLELPRQGNSFDLSTIADVLFTIDYTALEDLDYRATVIRGLNVDRTRHADRIFSLRTQYPDAWWALNNPDPPAADGSRTAPVAIGAADVPSQLEGLVIENVSVQLISDTDLPSVTITLAFAGQSGQAETSEGGAGTNRGNAAAWIPLCGGSPIGTWTITLDSATAALLDAGTLDDVLLVLGCAGDVPAWTF